MTLALAVGSASASFQRRADMRAKFVAGIFIVALGGWHAARPRPRASRDRRTHDGGLPTLLPAVTIAADTQGLEDGTPSSSEAGARRLLQTPACGLSLLLHKFSGCCRRRRPTFLCSGRCPAAYVHHLGSQTSHASSPKL